MGSIPVGSTKTTVKTVVFYFQRRIEGRRSVVPIPVRSTSSLIHGSTKKQTLLCLLLPSLRRIERKLTQPDSRTLGVLAAIREYQNDSEDSRFLLPTENRKTTFVVPIPVRSAGSLIYGSTKTTVKTVVFI